jgi:hypothetical protein
MDRHQLIVPVRILPGEFVGDRRYSLYQQPWFPKGQYMASYIVGTPNDGPKSPAIVDDLKLALREPRATAAVGDIEQLPPIPGLELVFEGADPRVDNFLRLFSDDVIRSQPRRPLYLTTGQLLIAVLENARRFSGRAGL